MASGASVTAAERNGRGRAFGSGPGRRGLLIAAAAVVAIAAVVVAVVLSSGGSSRPTGREAASAAQRYGKIPDWLPKPTAPTDHVVVASAAHPVLAAVEGDTVDAHLSAGSVDVTGVGPAVPSSVSAAARSDNDGTSLAPSTFLVTFASPKGVIPLNPLSFSILTAQGQIVHPAVTLRDGGRLPAQLTPGRTLTLTLKTDLPEGEGALRWAPDGERVLVAWFYDLELD